MVCNEGQNHSRPMRYVWNAFFIVAFCSAFLRQVNWKKITETTFLGVVRVPCHN